MLPALGHIGPEVRSFYSVSDKTCLLAGAEQEGPAHNPWSTHGPHPVQCVHSGDRDAVGSRLYRLVWSSQCGCVSY